MKEREHVIDILKKAKVAIQSKDVLTLKSLSDQTIHMISLYKDTDSLSLAVIMYSFSKLLEKEIDENKRTCTKICILFMDFIARAISSLEKGNERAFRKNIESVTTSLNTLSPRLQEFVSDILMKAKINKAFKIHEHGISLAQTAKLFGITLWDVVSYAGQKVSSNQQASRTLNPLSRIKLAEDFFNEP